MEEVAITLTTLAGDSHSLCLPATAVAFEGKRLVAAELERPAELQRWLVDGKILEDGDLLASFHAADSKMPLQVLCVFLPRTFDVKVKVVKFTPGSQAQSAAEVSISVSPTLTVDAAKFEALTAASASLGAGSAELFKAARLIKGGLHMKEEKTIEHYHIDPDSTLHLIIPRGRSDDHTSPGNSSGITSNTSGEYSNDDATRTEAEMFHKISSNEITKDEIINSSGKIEERGKDVLSPCSKERASVFTKMGVHRLRPRRAASMPASKSRGMQEASDASPQIGLIASRESIQSSNDGKSSSEAKDWVSKAAAAEFGTPAACHPQKPRGPRDGASRPLRGQPASRSSHPSPAAPQSTTPHSNDTNRSALKSPMHAPQSPVGLMRPPKAPVSAMRPATRPGASTERPVGEQQRPLAANVPSPPQVSQQHTSADCCTSSPWVCEWMAQGTSSLKAGHPSSVPDHQSRARQAVSGRGGVKRSSSCCPAGIDRWHFVARLC